jgi:hypothetical protein
VLREDVENQHRAIDDWQRDDALEIFALSRPQVVQNQEDFGSALLCELRDLTRLAASDQGGGIDVQAFLHDTLEDLRARRVCKRFKLSELRFDRPPSIAGVYRDNERRCSISQWSPSL